jgi:hippurate hydrolase
VLSVAWPYHLDAMTNPASTYIGDPPSHAELSELKAIRHHLHQHPELGFKEVSTAAKVAELLELWGYTVTREVGCTGIVGTLRKGTSQRAIMLRADMDALPMQENTGLPYESVNAGTMHACGHDGHTAMLLGGAREIAQRASLMGPYTCSSSPPRKLASIAGHSG